MEELSSQRRNEKLLNIGDGPEMRETELNVLQRLRNKGARSERREAVLGTLLKLLMKDKLLHSGKVPMYTELMENRSSVIWHFEGGDEDVME